MYANALVFGMNLRGTKLMKQIRITEKEYILLCATLIKKIEKMKKTIATYGLQDMREDVGEYEKLLTYLESNG